MREVLISIQPKWCKLICSGEKTVEVRKNRPNCELPFKCYIYCTKGKPTFSQSAFCDEVSNGKVIGEFVCDSIIVAKCGSYCKIPTKLSQVDAIDLMDYADGKTVYGWHIADLVVYDEPRELGEFSSAEKKSCPAYLNGTCLYRTQNQVIRCEHLDCEHKKITRSPQSWQFCVATEPRQTAD